MIIMSKCRNYITTNFRLATTITATYLCISICGTGCTDTLLMYNIGMDFIYLFRSLSQICSTIITYSGSSTPYFITSTIDRNLISIMGTLYMGVCMLAGYRCCSRCRSYLGSFGRFMSRGSCCLWSSRTLRLFCCSRLCCSCYRCSLCTRLCSALRFCSRLRCCSRLRSLGCLGVRTGSNLCICLFLSRGLYRCSLLFIYSTNRRLRNATDRINTAFFVTKLK